MIISLTIGAFISYILSNCLKTINQSVLYKINCIFDNLNPKSTIALKFNTFFLLRRLLIAFLLAFLVDSPTTQIILLIISTILNFIYLLSCYPYQHKCDNIMEIINETFILIALTHLVVFSDFVESIPMKQTFGLSLSLLILIQILINTVVVLVLTISNVINFVKIRR